jgi:predicted alpha/beta hydrolase family esterase
MTRKLHVVHSRGGRIGGRADTYPGDVDAIVQAVKADPRRHLVLHFHGGLVSKEAGLAIVQRLLVDRPVYSPSAHEGGWPVFYVWESGAWETIRNNLTELADEPVFKQLLRKLMQYALEELGGQGVEGFGRSVMPASRGAREAEVRKAFDQFWAQPQPATVPYRGFEILAEPARARAAGAAIDEDEIRADLEADRAFLQALATLPDLPPATRSSFAPAGVGERRSAFSKLASAEFSKSAQTRGLVEIVQVARFLIKVLRAVLARRAGGRDHGLYATCVEEAVRAFKLAGSGLNEWGKALQWNRMKQDTVDAFGPDADVHAGTALLARLGHAIAGGMRLDRITLVGHSTGAIYIAHWLARSAAFLPPAVKHDIVFLAPAISFDLWARTLREHGSRIGGFRLFGMQDRVERDDQVWGSDHELDGAQDWRRYLYPSSLLYLVSGILESRRAADGSERDEADVPLLGMQRYHSATDVYNEAAGFGDVDAVRAWLAARSGAAVWSKAEQQAPGFNCTSVDHGAFDDDEQTLASLRHIVTAGF